MITSVLKDSLTREARALGFDAIGIAEPGAIAGVREKLDAFLASGAHGEMAWLADPRRGDPRQMWADVRSVIMLGVNYGPDDNPLAILAQRSNAAISVYARGDDYHDLIKKRLKALARWLIAKGGGDVKVFVDTAAVMEKPLAQAAGLGGQGKHTHLVSRELGSWPSLGASFTTLQPGDVIVSGTPGGVGAKRTPPVWMKAGDRVEIEVSKVGVLVNTIVAETV